MAWRIIEIAIFYGYIYGAVCQGDIKCPNGRSIAFYRVTAAYLNYYFKVIDFDYKNCSYALCRDSLYKASVFAVNQRLCYIYVSMPESQPKEEGVDIFYYYKALDYTTELYSFTTTTTSHHTPTPLPTPTTSPSDISTPPDLPSPPHNLTSSPFYPSFYTSSNQTTLITTPLGLSTKTFLVTTETESTTYFLGTNGDFSLTKAILIGVAIVTAGTIILVISVILIRKKYENINDTNQHQHARGPEGNSQDHKLEFDIVFSSGDGKALGKQKISLPYGNDIRKKTIEVGVDSVVLKQISMEDRNGVKDKRVDDEKDNEHKRSINETGQYTSLIVVSDEENDPNSQDGIRHDYYNIPDEHQNKPNDASGQTDDGLMRIPKVVKPSTGTYSYAYGHLPPGFRR